MEFISEKIKAKMTWVVAKVKIKGDGKSWEETPRVGKYLLPDNDGQINIFMSHLATNFYLGYDELRWHRVGSQQGHYISLDTNSLAWALRYGEEK